MKISLYGSKSTGASFREFLAETIDDIGFRSSISYPGVWIRVATRPTGVTYYEYILCCVYYILCISHNARQTMGEIQKNMKFGNYKIKDSDFYLGYIFKKKELNI